MRRGTLPTSCPWAPVCDRLSDLGLTQPGRRLQLRLQRSWGSFPSWGHATSLAASAAGTVAGSGLGQGQEAGSGPRPPPRRGCSPSAQRALVRGV